MCEHGFTTEDASDGHAVESADELIIKPCLYAVCDAHLMERRILNDHLGQYPGMDFFFAVWRTFIDGAWHFHAILHDLGKRRIYADGERMVSERTTEGMGNVEIFGIKDEALGWREPPDGIGFIVWPWKNAILVGVPKDVRGERTAGGEKTVFIGLVQRWKCVVWYPAPTFFYEEIRVFFYHCFCVACE